MTTATLETRQDPKVCAQSLATLASLGILIHFVHEIVLLGGELSALMIALGVGLVAVTVALTAAWNSLSRPVRRTAAVLIGALWAVAASEHLVNVSKGGAAMDYTGLLTFAGGITLVFASYWDHHRPYEASR